MRCLGSRRRRDRASSRWPPHLSWCCANVSRGRRHGAVVAAAEAAERRGSRSRQAAGPAARHRAGASGHAPRHVVRRPGRAGGGVLARGQRDASTFTPACGTLGAPPPASTRDGTAPVHPPPRTPTVRRAGTGVARALDAASDAPGGMARLDCGGGRVRADGRLGDRVGLSSRRSARIVPSGPCGSDCRGPRLLGSGGIGSSGPGRCHTSPSTDGAHTCETAAHACGPHQCQTNGAPPDACHVSVGHADGAVVRRRQVVRKWRTRRSREKSRQRTSRRS